MIDLGEHSCQLQVWDTAGQERFQSLGNAFFRGADCCVVMYDVTNMSSFDNLTYWIESFFDIGGADGNFAILVLGNKSDLPQQVDSQKVERWCRKYDYHFLEVSAKTNRNIGGAFDKVIELAVHQHRPDPNVIQIHPYNLSRCCF